MSPVNGIKGPKKWQLARKYIESPSAGCLAQQLIERHEGYRKFPEKVDGRGVLVGYGADLSVRGLSELEAGILLARDITAIEIQLLERLWWVRLSPAQQAALIDTIYALGIERFLGFKQTISHLEAGEYPAAGDAMLESEHWRNFGPRAQEDAMIVAFSTPVNKRGTE